MSWLADAVAFLLRVVLRLADDPETRATLFGNFYERRRAAAVARSPRIPYAVKTEKFDFDVRWIANGKTNRFRMPDAVPARSVIDGRWSLMIDGGLSFFRARFEDDCLVLDGWVNENIEVRLSGSRSRSLDELYQELDEIQDRRKARAAAERLPPTQDAAVPVAVSAPCR